MIKAILLFLISFNVVAFDDNPYEAFDASRNFTQSNIIVWKVVDNVSAVCQAENRKRGFNGWKYKVEACAFWNETNSKPYTCTIFTGRYTSMHQIGHELRHCYQGPYHD